MPDGQKGQVCQGKRLIKLLLKDLQELHRNSSLHFIYCSRELMEFSLMTSPNGDGVIAVGGISGSDYQDSILKMTCTGSLSCEWTELDQKLEVGRKSQVAFLIPDELTSCE